MPRCARRPVAALFGTAVLLLMNPAIAATPSRTACNPDKIKQTNAWVDCLQKALDKSETELAAVVGKIAAAMAKTEMLEEPKRSENKALFDKTQGNWLALRDDDCRAYGAQRAGLGFGAVQFRLVCLVDETAARVEALKTRHREELQ